MDRAYLQPKIDKVKALIDAYEDASLAIAGGGTEMYRLDTGQSIINVTKFNIGTLEKTISSLYNRLATLQSLLGGCGTITARPGW